MKSTNSSVHGYVQCRQTTKFQAHKIKWFYSTIFLIKNVLGRVANWEICLLDRLKWWLVQQKSNKRREITLRQNAQYYSGQSDDWVFHVSLATCTCNVRRNMLSRIGQSTQHHFKLSVDTLVIRQFSTMNMNVKNVSISWKHRGGLIFFIRRNIEDQRTTIIHIICYSSIVGRFEMIGQRIRQEFMQCHNAQHFLTNHNFREYE